MDKELRKIRRKIFFVDKGRVFPRWNKRMIKNIKRRAREVWKNYGLFGENKN